MSLAQRPKPSALPRAPELGAGPSRAPSGARRPSAPPAGLAAGDSRLHPTPFPNLEGTSDLALYNGARSWGAGRGRPSSGRGFQPRHAVSLPLASPQLPAAPSPHPTTPIKVHFGRESGLGLPLAPPGGTAHFGPRELSGPGGGGGSRAWPPLPPGAGWRSPRIELVGLLRRTFFSLRRPQHRARLASGSLRAGKSLWLTPSSPARCRLLRRGSGADWGGRGGGAGENGEGPLCGRWTKPAVG